MVVQRLDSQSVTRDEELLLSSVPDRECKHSPEMLDAVCTILFIQVHDRFGVAVRSIDVPTRDELFAQREVVVDLSVVDDPEITVFIRDGLVARGKVHDA